MSLIGPVVLHATCMLLLVDTSDRLTPTDIFEGVRDSVVFIVNVLENGDQASGTGFLIDPRRRLAVTAYHVVDEEKTVSVFSPAKERPDEYITDRNIYMNRIQDLERVGCYSRGRVIAKDKVKDLAILELERVSPGAKGLELADEDPEEQDFVCVVGHPAARDLWRLTIGQFRRSSRRIHDYSNNQHVDFLGVFFYSDTFHGNSGGPIFNKDGEVIGVLHAGGGEAGESSVGVHWSEVASLIDTVRAKAVWGVENKLSFAVTFQTKWGDGEWRTHTLVPGHALTFSNADGLTPYIRYDYSIAPGSQARTYELGHFSRQFGRNGHADLKLDAMEYEFKRTNLGFGVFKK